MRKVIKKLYELLPFKKELFSIVKIFYIPKDSIFRHLHFKGIIDVAVSERKKFKMYHYGFQLENEIFWKGLDNGWEQYSIDIWKKMSLISEVIIDVGANTGVFSLVSKAINLDSKVYAFEPVSRVYEKLEENIKLNKFNIETHRLALSNFNGKAKIFDGMGEHVYSVTVNKNLNSPDFNVIETEIDVERIDHFVERKYISKIDLIKIDVETHEPEVLKGFGVYLKKFQPTILIEILNDEVANEVHEIVRDMNYLYFNIDENSGIRKVDKIEKSDYYNLLLCQEEIARYLKLIT